MKVLATVSSVKILPESLTWILSVTFLERCLSTENKFKHTYLLRINSNSPF